MPLFEHPYVYFTVLGLFAFLGALLAKKYQRNLLFWSLATLFFCLTGVFILFLLGPKQKKKIQDPLSEKKKIPKELSVLSWYYLDDQNTKRGPFSAEGIKKLWEEGALKGHSYLWNETLEEWKKAQEFTFLQENLDTNLA